MLPLKHITLPLYLYLYLYLYLCSPLQLTNAFKGSTAAGLVTPSDPNNRHAPCA
jgi:hypothetical protein